MNVFRPLHGSITKSWSTPWVLALAGVALFVLLVALVMLGFRLARPGVLPGVEVAGVPMGGHDRATLVEEVEELATTREQATVVVSLSEGADHEVASVRSELGYDADAATTIEAAWLRGRQLNPFTALRDHLRAFRWERPIELRETVDEAELDAWVADVSAELDHEPVEGSVEIDGTDVTVVHPQTGAITDRASLREQAWEVVLAQGPQGIVAPAEAVEPDLTRAEVERVADLAREAVSGPVRLTRDDHTIELSAAEIGDVLYVERDGDGLVVRADPDELPVDDDTVAALAAEPVDATIRIADGDVVIDPSADGFAFDAEIAAAQVVDVALSRSRSARLDGIVMEPELTTEEAEGLGITERVSTFTTYHACCQGRVQNIQRMADIVRGVLLRPGEELSLNDHVGERTRAKGFTDGGVIIRGEFEEAVGGGISQFATTFFNAAYEGGYEILQHQPHSYYISRYPVGRESTINWPSIDVRIRNDSPYGLLVHTRYTPTSITVDFYGQQWVDVASVTSPRRDVREPPVEYEENPELEPGQERIIQDGRSGFRVTYTRRRTFPDGQTDEQTWTHRYRAEPRIIERNSAEPVEDATPASATPGGTGDTPDDGEDAPAAVSQGAAAG